MYLYTHIELHIYINIFFETICAFFSHQSDYSHKIIKMPKKIKRH